MSTTPPPNSLVQWFEQLGLQLQDQLSTQQLQSGRAVGKIMKIVYPQYNLQLLASNTAVNRVSNWNNLINQLKKVGIRVSQDQKTKIINGNHEVVYQILIKLHDYYNKNQKETEVDISKINPKSQIGQSSSLLQLFILTIMKYFNLNAKQSVALLSSQCKYLAHILVKGLKGEFKPIQNFMNQMIKNIQAITGFCKNKQNQTFFIRAIKPALISKSQIAAEKAINLLQQFLNAIPNRYEIIKQNFASTILLSIRRHPHLINQLMNFTIKTTNYSKDLFVLFKSQATQVQLQNIFLSIFSVSKDSRQLSHFFELKNVSQMIAKSIENIKNSETALSSINLLLTLSAQNTEILSDPQRGSKFIQYIQSVTLAKKSQSFVFIQQLFTLLSIFGKDKNQLAPTLFKILITKYQNSLNNEQSKLYIQNFIQTIKQFPTIPVGIIVEAVNNRVQTGTLRAEEQQMMFFKQVVLMMEENSGGAANVDIDVKVALIIYNIVSKLLVEQPAYCGVATQVLIGIIRKFHNDHIIIDLTIKLIKVCLAMHFANVKRLASKRKSVTGTSKIDTDDVLSKSKNISMQNFIYKLVQQQISEVNKSAEPLICYSLIQVQHLSKQNASGLRKIISLFGDASQIIKKYENQAKKLQQQQSRKQQTKKSKLKQSAWGGVAAANKRYQQTESQPQSRQKGISHISSYQAMKGSKLKITKLDPMLLSSVGVTPAAMKGLQKYQKTYLNKIEKLQQQQVKKKQHQDRQVQLKKIFQRKMLQKGIQVKKFNNQQFRYLYQFGVKQKQIQQDTVKHNIMAHFYSPEQQQQRDTKSLQYTIKKYQKILKLYYNIYSGHIKPQNLDSFEQMAQKVNLLYSSGLWKFIKQHGLDQFISVKQVQFISKKVNYELDKKFDDSTALDYQGFQQFIIQVSYCMFTRPPKDMRGKPISQMIQETISNLKLYASENKINQKLFQDPDNVFYNQTQAVKQLNKKLQANPDYILPEGYKKITQKKVIFTHRIFLDAMSPSYKDVYQIIDEMLHGAFNIHLIEPFTTYQTVAKARPNLYFKQRAQGQGVNALNISTFLKKQVSKMPIKDRQTGKQVASVLDQIVTAVQCGHEQLGLKYQNKIIKQKKMMQQEINKKQEQQKRKWADRNRQIKSALVKHKETLTEKQKQQEQKKQEAKRKQQEQKRKREQQQKRLKKKVQEYQNKKKQEDQKAKKQQGQKKKKQKQDMERKKKQSQELKKKIQQTKQKKEQQQKQRKKLQQMAQKERKIAQKKKFEEDQKRKKQMVQQFRNKRGDPANQSQLTQSPNLAKSVIKAVDSQIKPQLQRKKLI